MSRLIVITKEELKDKYITQSWTQHKIAAFYKCSRSVISARLKKFNLLLKERTEFFCKTCGETDKQFFKNRVKTRCNKCLQKQSLQQLQKRKQRMIDYKGSVCQICGYSKYTGALEFHHIDPSTKEMEVRSIPYARTKSWDKIITELDKCILLCSNCHREVHADITQLPVNYIHSIPKYAKNIEHPRKGVQSSGIRGIDIKEN